MKTCERCKKPIPKHKLTGKRTPRFCRWECFVGARLVKVGTHQKCKKCGVVKPIGDYYFNKRRGVPHSSPYHSCKACSYADHRSRNRERKLEVLAHYGGTCACCGESRHEFLALHHLNGDGNKHRKSIHPSGKWPIHHWIVKNNFPSGFGVLCHNCNFSLGAFGYCPHNKSY